VNGEYVRIWKGMVVAYFKYSSGILFVVSGFNEVSRHEDV